MSAIRQQKIAIKTVIVLVFKLAQEARVLVRTSKRYETTMSLSVVSLPCVVPGMFLSCEGVALPAFLQLPRYSYTQVQQHMCVLTTASQVPGTWEYFRLWGPIFGFLKTY